MMIAAAGYRPMLTSKVGASINHLEKNPYQTNLSVHRSTFVCISIQVTIVAYISIGFNFFFIQMATVLKIITHKNKYQYHIKTPGFLRQLLIGFPGASFFIFPSS